MTSFIHNIIKIVFTPGPCLIQYVSLGISPPPPAKHQVMALYTNNTFKGTVKVISNDPPGFMQICQCPIDNDTL